MPDLRKGLGTIYGLLKDHEAGDIVSASEILTATKWKESSLQTYVRKNKLAGFLSKRADGRFDVLRNGSTLTEADIAGALTQVTPDATRFLPHERIRGQHGEYELVEERGRGATAHVWVGETVTTRERVAIKLVNPRPDLLSGTVFRDLNRRFRREAENGRKLSSSYLIQHIDSGAYRNNQFLVMELADQSLKDSLERRGQLTVDEANRAIARCVVGLHHLHLTASIHRDVKPANMLVTTRGVVLGDLGIVKWSDLNPDFVSAGTITTAAVNLGSLNYMAPEQRDAPKNVNASADVYSLGVSWYELLTNERPSPSAFAARKTGLPSTDSQTNELIAAMTSYEPSDRPSIATLLDFFQMQIDEAVNRVSA